MLNFYPLTQVEKGETWEGKVALLSVYGFSDITLKSISVCALAYRQCRTEQEGFLVHEPPLSVTHMNLSVLVSDLKPCPPFPCNNLLCELLLLDFPAVPFWVYKSVPRATVASVSHP